MHSFFSLKLSSFSFSLSLSLFFLFATGHRRRAALVHSLVPLPPSHTEGLLLAADHHHHHYQHIGGQYSDEQDFTSKPISRVEVGRFPLREDNRRTADDKHSFLIDTGHTQWISPLSLSWSLSVDV